METLGDIIIAIGAAFIFFGVVGIFKYDNFYTRMLIAAKIDIVGIITVMLGIVIKHGMSFFSLKSIMLLGIMMLLAPMVSHMIARAAYLSGYQMEIVKGLKNDSAGGTASGDDSGEEEI